MNAKVATARSKKNPAIPAVKFLTSNPVFGARILLRVAAASSLIHFGSSVFALALSSILSSLLELFSDSMLFWFCSSLSKSFMSSSACWRASSSAMRRPVISSMIFFISSKSFSISSSEQVLLRFCAPS